MTGTWIPTGKGSPRGLQGVPKPLQMGLFGNMKIKFFF